MRKEQTGPTPIEMEHVTIFEQLKKEHDDLRLLMAQTERDDVKNRKHNFSLIAKALIPHARSEEKTLYALMRRRAEKTKGYNFEVVIEGYEEHRALDDLVANLKKMSATNERWLPLFKVLKANLLHHFAKEEEHIWKEAQSLFTMDE